MVDENEETYIVINALDECLDERSELLSCIEDVASWNDASLHVWTTSRREKDIEGKRFRHICSLPVSFY